MKENEEYTKVPFRVIRTAEQRITYIVGSNPLAWWNALEKPFKDAHQMGAPSPATKEEYDAFMHQLTGGRRPDA